jgi:two-component system response regulator RegA
MMTTTMLADIPAAAAVAQPLLLVDDDQPFRQRLQLTLERKGFAVTGAGSVAEARRLASGLKPSHAVVDLRLEDGNGLDLVTELRALRPDIKIVVLTGDYLAKPADPEDIVRALIALPGERPEAPAEPMSADRVRWEHIQRVYELCGRNVSETARRLKMHRRTLQRILAKRSPR